MMCAHPTASLRWLAYCFCSRPRLAILARVLASPFLLCPRHSRLCPRLAIPARFLAILARVFAILACVLAVPFSLVVPRATCDVLRLLAPRPRSFPSGEASLEPEQQQKLASEAALLAGLHALGGEL